MGDVHLVIKNYFICIVADKSSNLNLLKSKNHSWQDPGALKQENTDWLRQSC